MTDYLSDPPDYRDPRVAPVFDEMSYWGSQFAHLIFENLELRPNLNVLDVGCGTGCPLFELAHMHGQSCRFTRLDPWQSGLERAAYKLAIYALPNVKLVRLDDDRFPFPDAEFDLIVSNLGLNNFEKPQVVLNECARVAKPGARIVFTTNLNGHMREFYEVYRAVLTEFGNPRYLAQLEVNENHRGTRESHLQLVESAGFKVYRVIERSLTLRYLDGSALLRHALTRFGFLQGWRRVVDPADERAIFTTLETRLNMLAAERGDLAMIVPMLYLEGARNAV